MNTDVQYYRINKDMGIDIVSAPDLQRGDSYENPRQDSLGTSRINHRAIRDIE